MVRNLLKNSNIQSYDNSIFKLNNISVYWNDSTTCLIYRRIINLNGLPSSMILSTDYVDPFARANTTLLIMLFREYISSRFSRNSEAEALESLDAYWSIVPSLQVILERVMNKWFYERRLNKNTPSVSKGLKTSMCT